MAINNFKELQREQSEQFRSNTNRVNKSIKSNLRAFNFIGEIFDLYITRAFGYLTNMSKDNEADSDDGSDRYPGSV